MFNECAGLQRYSEGGEVSNFSDKFSNVVGRTTRDKDLISDVAQGEGCRIIRPL